MQGHGLRATFASIAEELVSSALLKRMMNHAAVGDVTLGHYVAKSEAQLRVGWQAVADFVEAAALTQHADSGTLLQRLTSTRVAWAASACAHIRFRAWFQEA